MNKDLMFSSKTDLWATPQTFFDELNSEFGFDTDVCALASNAKCAKFFTPEVNGLTQAWEGVCWMNPPYGRGIGGVVEESLRIFTKRSNRHMFSAFKDRHPMVARLLHEGGSSLYQGQA